MMPTKTGWYWVRHPKEGTLFVWVKDGYFCIRYFDVEYDYWNTCERKLSFLEGAEWSGPIPEPGWQGPIQPQEEEHKPTKRQIAEQMDMVARAMAYASQDRGYGVVV